MIKKTREKYVLQELCPFGEKLVKTRKDKGISQSRLGIISETNLSNLRRIERGDMQPGIMTALRLVLATDTRLDDFFINLAVSEKIYDARQAFNIAKSKILERLLYENYTETLSSSEQAQTKSPFGILLKDYRVLFNVSQKALAEYASYNLRNMLNVEKGLQDTGVMQALAMIAYISQKSSVDIGAFFRVLQMVVKDRF